MSEHATAASALWHLSTRDGVVGERARLASVSLDACWLLLSGNHPSAAFVVSRAMLEQHVTNRMVWQRSESGRGREVSLGKSLDAGLDPKLAAVIPGLNATGRLLLGVDNELNEAGLVQSQDTWDRYLKFDDALASLAASANLHPMSVQAMANLYSFLSGFAHPSITSSRIAGDGAVNLDGARRHAATEVSLAVLLFVSWLDVETLTMAVGEGPRHTDWVSRLNTPDPNLDITYLGRSIDPIAEVLRDHEGGACQERIIRAMTR